MENILNNITLKLEKFRKFIQNSDEYESSMETLDEIIQDSKEPLLVMVMGEFSTGKSTFINALVGEEVAAVNATPTTAVITKLCYGEIEKTIVHYKDGSKEENPDVDFVNLTAENQAAFQRHDEISFVERRIPMEMLKSMSIIDSPGLNSIKKGHTAATRDFMDKADTVLWMFDANKPVSKTEIAAMAKLNPRLEPIAIVNKMDTLNDDEDDEAAFLDGIRQKLKDKVQRVIGISAKLAFMGKKEHNEKLLAASNLQEFYDTLDELVLPNIEKYKMNTLLDGMIGYLADIHEQIDLGETIVAGLQDEDYASYVEERQKQVELRDELDEMLSPLYEYAVAKKKNISALSFLAILYKYGILLEKDEALAVKMFEEAAMRNELIAQISLSAVYMDQNEYDKGLYWLHRLVEQEIPVAQYVMGVLYEKGFGVAENIEEAVKLYEKAAQQESGEGLYQLAECYKSAHGVPKDISKYVELLEKGVKVGNEESMVALATVYKNGEYLPKNEKYAFELYEKAAKKGDANGQVSLAVCYIQGIGTEVDAEKGVYWLRRAAFQDNNDAQCILGTAYKKGYGVAENQAKAVVWLKRAAEKGDDDAMLELADMEQEPAKAIEWLEKAAELGNTEAKVKLGYYCYGYGKALSDEADNTKAFEWYMKAAEYGNVNGMFYVGFMYDDGKGVGQDYKKAMEWYQKAAENGHAIAMNNIGVLYHCGCGVIQSYEKAIKWYQKAIDAGYSDAEKDLNKAKAALKGGINQDKFFIKGEKSYAAKEYKIAMGCYQRAADNGNADAMYKIGNMFFYGEGVTLNRNKAFQWFRKAADLGNASAMNIIGYNYDHGQGVDQDHAEAMKWYRKAADLGDATAMCNIGYNYEYGYGVNRDYAESMKWYRKAADLGDADAMFAIGYNYDHGQGVDQDYTEAMKWYCKAADLGHVDAMHIIGANYNYGRGVKQDYAEAMKWYRKAADLGNVSAMNSIGYNYDHGCGGVLNHIEAMKWYRKAAELGNATAMNNLGYMYHHGKGIARNYSEAKNWYEKALKVNPDDTTVINNLQQLQYDFQHNNSNNDSFCFITTAVCDSFNKPDDCYELTMFRDFRDKWLSKQADGMELIREYYEIAPGIVHNINLRHDAKAIYKKIWRKYLSKCLKYIEEGDNKSCKELYVSMVNTLKEKF